MNNFNTAIVIIILVIIIFYLLKNPIEEFLTGPSPVKDPLRDFTVDCGNKYLACNSWAAGHECKRNANFMLHNCPTACGVCKMTPEQKEAAIKSANMYDYQKNIKPCVDNENYWRCENLKLNGWCQKNHPFMEKNCRQTCGRCQYNLNFT